MRRYLPELTDLVLKGTINPRVAEGYRAMDERRAIKALLRPLAGSREEPVSVGDEQEAGVGSRRLPGSRSGRRQGMVTPRASA